MQGDPRIDVLMQPVKAAIRRHGKSQDAFTDIYNRAYEAIMKSMDVNVATLTAENARLEQQRESCESALVSMVQQYLYRPLDNKTKEPSDNTYQHDFMSAGEEACYYLVDRGLAQWTDDDRYAITLPPPPNPKISCI